MLKRFFMQPKLNYLTKEPRIILRSELLLRFRRRLHYTTFLIEIWRRFSFRPTILLTSLFIVDLNISGIAPLIILSYILFVSQILLSHMHLTNLWQVALLCQWTLPLIVIFLYFLQGHLLNIRKKFRQLHGPHCIEISKRFENIKIYLHYITNST